MAANLRTAEFVALGSDVQHFDYTLLTGGSVPVSSYSLRVGVEDGEVEIADPRFLVVHWQEQPRLLALSFADDTPTR